MEEKDYSDDNIIVIESLLDYLAEISKINEKIKQDEGATPSNQQLYFRGQANSAWDIIPSIYRGNLLGIEYDLIYSAWLRNPEEFRIVTNNFERLAKLQHYGLPTRLLDVTTNPLVALYFACQLHNEIQENEETGSKEVVLTDGVVFYNKAYSSSIQDVGVETVAFLASNKVQGDFTLENCLNLLVKAGIYSNSTAEDCRKNNYKSLIESLQNNYFVISTLNNERLVRQSGAFILTGCYNIIFNSEKIGESLIQRAVGNLSEWFEKICFVIPTEKKSYILEELDLYNINEGSLFPELDHQLYYIKHKKAKGATASPLGKFNKIVAIDEDQKHNMTSSFINNDNSDNEKQKRNMSNLFIDDKDSEKIFKTVLSEHIKQTYVEDVLNGLKNELCLDWYRKESVLSKMRLNITKILVEKPEFNHISAAEKAKDLMESILNRLESSSIK